MEAQVFSISELRKSRKTAERNKEDVVEANEAKREKPVRKDGFRSVTRVDAPIKEEGKNDG